MQENFHKMLKEAFGIKIQEEHYYDVAFTHSSYANEHRKENLIYNEKIEFLGDAVLDLAVSDFIYRQFPELNEGQLSKFRAVIVCEDSLSLLAKEYKLNEFIRLGKGEEKNGGRHRQSILADLFESFIGALYQDQGLEEVNNFLGQTVFPKIINGDFPLTMDSKTDLQELLQAEQDYAIEYRLEQEEGPAHNKTFYTSVYNRDEKLGQGSGQTKKVAQQMAAWDALKKLKTKGE